MKITGDNKWKFESSYFFNKSKVIRKKFYNKSLDKLLSLGVKNTKIGDPLSKLFLTKDQNKYHQPVFKHHRKNFTYRGNSICRLEVSIYSR